jgi:hypothetical protein
MVGLAAFCEEVKRGDLAAIKRALGAHPGLLHSKLGAAARTPLHVAAAGSHQLVLRLLLQHGADCAAADALGEVPLMVAAREVRGPAGRARACAGRLGPKCARAPQSPGARPAGHQSRRPRRRPSRATSPRCASCSRTAAAAPASRPCQRTARRRCTSPRRRARRRPFRCCWTLARAPTRTTGCACGGKGGSREGIAGARSCRLRAPARACARSIFPPNRLIPPVPPPAAAPPQAGNTALDLAESAGYDQVVLALRSGRHNPGARSPSPSPSPSRGAASAAAPLSPRPEPAASPARGGTAPLSPTSTRSGAPSPASSAGPLSPAGRQSISLRRSVATVSAGGGAPGAAKGAGSGAKASPSTKSPHGKSIGLRSGGGGASPGAIGVRRLGAATAAAIAAATSPGGRSTGSGGPTSPGRAAAAASPGGRSSGGGGGSGSAGVSNASISLRGGSTRRRLRIPQGARQGSDDAAGVLPESSAYSLGEDSAGAAVGEELERLVAEMAAVPEDAAEGDGAGGAQAGAKVPSAEEQPLPAVEEACSAGADEAAAAAAAAAQPSVPAEADASALAQGPAAPAASQAGGERQQASGPAGAAGAAAAAAAAAAVAAAAPPAAEEAASFSLWQQQQAAPQLQQQLKVLAEAEAAHEAAEAGGRENAAAAQQETAAHAASCVQPEQAQQQEAHQQVQQQEAHQEPAAAAAPAASTAGELSMVLQQEPTACPSGLQQQAEAQEDEEGGHGDGDMAAGCANRGHDVPPVQQHLVTPPMLSPTSAPPPGACALEPAGRGKPRALELVAGADALADHPASPLRASLQALRQRLQGGGGSSGGGGGSRGSSGDGAAAGSGGGAMGADLPPVAEPEIQPEAGAHDAAAPTPETLPHTPRSEAEPAPAGDAPAGEDRALCSVDAAGAAAADVAAKPGAASAASAADAALFSPMRASVPALSRGAVASPNPAAARARRRPPPKLQCRPPPEDLQPLHGSLRKQQVKQFLSAKAEEEAARWAGVDTALEAAARWAGCGWARLGGRCVGFWPFFGLGGWLHEAAQPSHRLCSTLTPAPRSRIEAQRARLAGVEASAAATAEALERCVAATASALEEGASTVAAAQDSAEQVIRQAAALVRQRGSGSGSATPRSRGAHAVSDALDEFMQGVTGCLQAQERQLDELQVGRRGGVWV